jgi:hypothetical protein
MLTHEPDLIRELSRDMKLINKNNLNAIFLENERYRMSSTSTELLEEEDLGESDFITPTLIQEKIDYVYEVRAFFLEGKFYSAAIFIEKQVQGVDYRKLRGTDKFRIVPYQLPADIEIRLVELIKSLNLKTASVDLLVNENEEHIFLELNSNGQFGFVSEACNYFLERQISMNAIIEV